MTTHETTVEIHPSLSVATSTVQSSKPVSPQRDRFVHDRLPAADQLPTLVYSRPELVIADQINLADALFQYASDAGHGDRAFLRSDAVTLTYHEAWSQVQQISAVLIDDFSLAPGNRVLLRGGNTIGMALAWLGVVNAGLIAVATMPLLRAKELGEIIDKAAPALALCDASLVDELELARTAHPVLKTVVLFNKPQISKGLEQRAASKADRHNACPVLADDIAMMAFTSGTTGTPKAAVHSHRDILAACEAWPQHVLQALPEDIVMGSPPLAFTFGLGGLLLFPMRAGASVYYPSQSYTPEGMVILARRIGATITYTAPTFYRQMAPFARASGTPGLRICVSAGESLPDATRQLWKDATGIDIVDGIGATEMFHIFISSAGSNIRRGAIGQVVPGYTAKVVDEDGVELPRGTVGKLAVIGPTGCRYLNDARQSNYVRNGWNYPGDAFLQDDDGYFFYQARADDMIITAGYNVAGPEVEQALMKHEAVLECAVIGVPDSERGMAVKAFVVLRPDHAHGSRDALVKALQDHVKTELAPFKYPRQIEFRAALPRTETGKLQRFKLRST